MSASEQFTKALVREEIYRSISNMDEQKWDDRIDQGADNFTYKCTTYSHEIRKDLTYLMLTKKEMNPYFDLLPKHNSDHSVLRRHATVYTVDLSEDGKTAEAVTSFLISRELLDGENAAMLSGENRLYLTGKYYDTLSIDGETIKFVQREARVFTRRFDRGTHVIF